jgi:hypothetical protein
MSGGQGYGVGNAAGDLEFSAGGGAGGATAGNIRLFNLPTADPAVFGALWIDTAAGRVLKVSAG